MGKKIALSIEQMKHLESLGLDTSDASMYWFIANPDIEHSLIDLRVYAFITPQKDDRYSIPAYTLQDILSKLPPFIKNYDNLPNDSTRESGGNQMAKIRKIFRNCMVLFV